MLAQMVEDQTETASLTAKKAYAKYKTIGLPSKKNDAFAYVGLDAFYQKTLEKASHSSICPTIQTEQFSTIVLGSNIVKDNHAIALALNRASTQFSSYLTRRALLLIEEESNPFALMNFFSKEEGAFIYIPAEQSIETPIYIHVDETNPFNRFHIVVGKNAKASIILHTFHDTQDLWTNTLFDIHLEENAHADLTIYSKKIAFDFLCIRSSLKRSSNFSCYNMTLGGKLQRHDYHSNLLEASANVTFKGLATLYEDRQFHAYINAIHKAKYTKSDQHFKVMAFDKSRSSFEGKIYVEKTALFTEAYQLNNNLLLSDKAVCFSKPNLEIFADDVKASHGCTTSKLDEEQLFYLNTRGLSDEKAKCLLTKAFKDELIHQVPHKFIQDEYLNS